MAKKIQQLSQALLIVFRILLIVLPVMVFLQWFLTDVKPINFFVASFGFFNPIGTVNIATHHFTLVQKGLGCVGTLIGLLPLLLALMLLIPIFKNYCAGKIFSLTNAQSYQKLGYLFFLDSFIAKPLCDIILTFTASLYNAPGHHYIAISFTMINLESLFCGAIIIVIAKVMYIGYKLQEEQQLVI